MKQIVSDYLMRDELNNIDMLVVGRIPKTQLLAVSERGVLLEHESIYFLANEPGAATEFLPLITLGLTDATDRHVVLRNNEIRETLERQYGFQTTMECYNAAYFARETIPYSLPKGAEIKKLDGSYADFVHAHYHMVDDLDYIRERIEEDFFGVFLRGEIAGFVGTHDEGSMGLLEILPDYRRLGLAYALEAHLINHLLAQGRVPFCQVALVNEPSIRLQKKLGLTISDRTIYWLRHASKA